MDFEIPRHALFSPVPLKYTLSVVSRSNRKVTDGIGLQSD